MRGDPFVQRRHPDTKIISNLLARKPVLRENDPPDHFLILRTQRDPHRILAKFLRPDCAHKSSPLLHITLSKERHQTATRPVLVEYRAEIAAEFEAYFAALSDHIACLDSERSRALSEAHVATEAYSTFLNVPPAQKDLP
jgi:hypothetical protein